MDITDMMVMGLVSFKVALVVHIAGVLLLFAAVGLEAAATILLRFSTSIGQIKLAMKIARRLSLLFSASTALIILSGGYMGYLSWSYGEEIGWIVVSLVFFVIISIFGSLSGKCMTTAVERALAESNGEMTEKLRQTIQSNLPAMQMCVSVSAILGLLAIMVFQPDILWTIVAFLIAIAVGVLVGLGLVRKKQ